MPTLPTTRRTAPSRLELAKRFTRERLRAGLTQAQLARRSGLDLSTVARLERGTARASLRHKLARSCACAPLRALSE